MTSMAYGYYEVRAKLPSESGAWPAIWLLGDMTADRPWPDTGEIDLVEWSSNDTSTRSPVTGSSAHCTSGVRLISRHTEAVQTSNGRAISVPLLMSGTPTSCGGLPDEIKRRD